MPAPAWHPVAALGAARTTVANSSACCPLYAAGAGTKSRLLSTLRAAATGSFVSLDSTPYY
ncbi:hypothetical protein U9M48_000914 [Paspalum notatum var. saurae]|uniref:Uncharacterized protein n=1 Tax=Paspalum notatum var. saurae TaxID=547442 RepID=A0AAQ3PFQ0_PASNO